MTQRLYRCHTTWGDAVLHVEDDCVVAIDPPQENAAPAEPLSSAPESVRAIAERIGRYVGFSDLDAITVPEPELERMLDAAGIEGFRRDVTIEMTRIPAGQTISYGELAARAGSFGAARAVGTVCANNPLALVVPCHRVVPASGKLGAFGFLGPTYKRKLLEHEGVTGAVLELS